ncbi:MarR family winged helix-turn-helix transcriptional regulator [Sphaerimonospora mesophila]|uniref:MarR family winged helix-turn-helix transcriptional regulator n=1 Tax=Sphaerimonospora mesophila TaxID=37483 RepID=UPI0009F8CF4D
MSTVGPGEATELWLRWKRAHEMVRAAVIAETTAASGVSESELSVLACLHESGGSLRQNALAAALGWDRTRLSHLLTRMADRGYVTRDKLPNGMEVALRPAGRHTINATLPTLETATRRHLLDRLGPDDAKTLKALIDRLLSGEGVAAEAKTGAPGVGAKRGRPPSSGTVMRMLRDHNTGIAELDAGADDASNGRSPSPAPEP